MTSELKKNVQLFVKTVTSLLSTSPFYQFSTISLLKEKLRTKSLKFKKRKLRNENNFNSDDRRWFHLIFLGMENKPKSFIYIGEWTQYIHRRVNPFVLTQYILGFWGR